MLKHETQSSNVPFQGSVGWIENFKKRKGIRLLKICGKKLSCDTSAVPVFIENFQKLLSDLHLTAEQVYNADES